jgi:transposase
MGIGLVAQAFGIDRSTIFRWLQRYDVNGKEGLQRRLGSGRPRVLADLTEEGLRRLILQPASHHGYETDLWTVGRVRLVIQDTYAIRISRNTVWRRLRESGLTYQKPERAYYEMDEEVRKEWAIRDSKNPPYGPQTQSHSVFSGRAERVSYRLLGQDVGDLRPDTEGQSDGKARRACRGLRHYSARGLVVSTLREADHLCRGGPVSGTNAEASQASSYSRRYGSGSTSCIEDDKILH